MKCQYCEKELKDGEKECNYCGAKVDFVENAFKVKPINNPVFNPINRPVYNNLYQKAPKNKKKITIIVIICSVLFGFMAFGATYVSYKYLEDNYDYYYDYSDDYDDEFYNYFSDGDTDDYYDGHYYSYDDEYGLGEYKSAEKFVKGTVDDKNNSYTSTFSGVSFELPTNWTIASKDKVKDLYEEQNVSSGIYENNLFVYDFYAEDSLTNASIYISYYNAEYFNEYNDIEDFNNRIKQEAKSFETYGYDVDYAEDSKLTIEGSEYYQMAARLSGNGKEYYQYDFTRYVDGYYLQISIFANDIDTVGTIVKALS